MLLARPGSRQLGEQGAHRRVPVGQDPDIAVPAGERDRLGQRAEGAGVIAAGGQRERPQRLDLDDAAGPALAGRGVEQPPQQGECRAGVVSGEQHPGQHQIGRLPRVIWLVVWAETSSRCPLGGRVDVALGQQQARPLRWHRVEQGDHLRTQPGLPGLAHRLPGPGRVTVRLPDPGHDSQAGGQRQGEGKLPAQRDPAGGVVKGGGQVVPLVQDLGQAHVRRAREGWLAALTEGVQRLPVGRQRRIQVALGALHLAQIVPNAHGEKASEERADGPPLGEHLGQAALGWLEPAVQPVRHRPVPVHEGAHEPVVLAQVGEGLPVVAGREGGIAAKPRERGAQERDPGADIGQHAIALWRSEGRFIWFVAADRKGALGVVEQGLECLGLEPLGGGVRLGQAQARAGAYRLRGQRRKPAAQGRALAAAEQLLHVPLHQPRGPGGVPGRQRVPHRVIGQVMLLAPGGRGPVQRLHPAGLLSPQPGAQQIGEQVVVAPPAAYLIQRHQKQARPLDVGQHRLAAGPSGDRITQLARQPLQHGGLQEERAHLPGLAVQDLIGQVVQHEAVAAAERRREPGRIGVPPQRQPGQLQPRRPPLGAGHQRLRRHGRQVRPRRFG